MTETNRSGLLILHGNRLELLAEAVLAWLGSRPLAPLEQETILVQSNGMAEWLKMEIARAHGVCAATTIELPARFVWRAYRAVLGRDAVPPASPLDKLALTWRLMRLLPDLANRPQFDALQGFLAGGGAARRLQLAQRLADLFDQYQVYRGDWLADWSRGADFVRADGQAVIAGRTADRVPDDHLWQPALWRLLLSTLTPAEQGTSRAELHARFIGALRAASARKEAIAGLPHRVVLFGTTHIARQTLDAIAALAAHCQVLLAVPNPCRYHWADIIDGRELLHFERRRQALRGGVDLSAVALQDMHAHGHPLLAAWGRQSRDFVRQLDAFDDATAARDRVELPRVELFDDAPGETLLQQVQAAVRDLLPLAEHARGGASAQDRSIVFHVAHSAQREVEILHDQLLRLLADPPGGRALAPRDIVVMVPDVDRFAPAIRSVFGQYAQRDARHIPWGIADQNERGREPLLVALEWLLHAPDERFGASQLRDLLDVPAVAARLRIAGDEAATLAQWIAGSGVRWGLDAAQRASLGLAASGEQNTWAFGLRRMLLGYASGEIDADGRYADIEPYAEVAGLGAGLAGSLAELLRTITQWWTDSHVARTPHAWAERLRTLTGDLFAPAGEAERAVLATLGDALAEWLQACEVAGFDDAVELAVVREAWLGAVDDPRVARRFRAGGVTFCTLLPLRAIPFEVVCLLGMNDGDYPRRANGIDFDLMALPGRSRPGDRSRRDDDRQLMLDALLSARRVLYVSWAGRSQRDNELQPPSVLVSQLRDYLAAGWGDDVLAHRTTEHPLQPFSRRYFEPAAEGDPAPLFTYATQWRAAHVETAGAAPAAAPAPPADAATPVTIQRLSAFLRNPVREFFRERLQVAFAEIDDANEDDEPFAGKGLERWSWIDEVLRDCRRALATEGTAATRQRIEQRVQRQLARLGREGRLPMGAPGRATRSELVRALEPMLGAWEAQIGALPQAHARLQLRIAAPSDDSLVFDDWLVGLRSAGAASAPVWVELQAGKLADPNGKKPPALRKDRLAAAWVRCLASAACATPAAGVVIGEGAIVRVAALDGGAARPVLFELMQAFREGLSGHAPLATALRTGCAWLSNPADAAKVFDGRDGNDAPPGEGKEACLARLYPDFASLHADPGFEAANERLYRRFLEWLETSVTVQLLEAPADAQGGDDA